MRRAATIRGRVRARPSAVLAAPALVLASACASLSDAPGDALAGCYQFRWDAGARALGLPWGFELLEEPLEASWPIARQFDDVRRARTATSPAERDDHPFGYWRMTPADSVEIGHPGGGGFTLRLAPQGQDLIGQGRAVGDVLLPGQEEGRPARPVVAQRVLCGAT